MAKTAKCPFCEVGVITIKHTKPSRANGITKYTGTCTNCGSHLMSTAGGQEILKKIYDGKEQDEYDFKEQEQEQEQEYTGTDENKQENDNKRSIIRVVLGLVITTVAIALLVR